MTPNGYLVRGKHRSEVVPFDDPRIKHVPADEEQRYYLCRNAGDPTGYLLCIYVPRFGS